jgi:tetratricopeptide (TPR) repeat protein
VVSEAYDHVYRDFDKSVAFYPHYMEAYYIMGRYYIDGSAYETQVLGKLDTGRLERGAEVLEHDIYMNPSYKWAHNNLGVIYDQLAGIYDIKADNLDKLAEKEKDGSGFRKRAEDLRLEAERYREKGRQSYKKALRVDPDQIFALNNLGNGYFLQAEKIVRKDGVKAARPYLEKGKPYFIDAIRVEPTAWKHYASLATICLWLGNFQEAIPYVEWAVFAGKTSMMEKYGITYSQKIADIYRSATSEIAANPGARPSLKNPGIAAEPLTRTEELDRAIGIYSEIKSGQKEGSSKWYLISLEVAETKEQKGDYAGAAREIESTFGPVPKEPAAWIDLAAYHALNGDREKAKELLSKRIVAEDPSALEKVLEDITASLGKRRLFIDEMRKKMKEAGEKEESVEVPDETTPDLPGISTPPPTNRSE